MHSKRTETNLYRWRLRKRYERCGLNGFADDELVELLLTLALPRSDVRAPARALIAHFGTLRNILDAPFEELRTVPGIGTGTPAALKLIREAATMYLQQLAERNDPLVSLDSLVSLWRMRIGALTNEVFEVAYLDSGRRVLRHGIERLTEGTADRATVYPRRVVEAALRRGAFGMLLAHNHPNGNVTPSDQDKALTRAIVLAAEIVGIRVVDHLIVSVDDAFSFHQAGLL